MPEKIIVSGVGCCHIDLLYKDIDFASETFRFLSLKRGDRGLTPGHLVFSEEFLEFAGLPFETVIAKITGGRKPDKKNIGGPSIVSLIHAAQLLAGLLNGNVEDGKIPDKVPFANCVI